MMDVVYLVKGIISTGTDEKSILYNGVSAKRAFGFLDNYQRSAEITVTIFEDGQSIRTIR